MNNNGKGGSRHVDYNNQILCKSLCPGISDLTPSFPRYKTKPGFTI